MALRAGRANARLCLQALCTIGNELVTTVDTTELLFLVGYLIAYMYLGINFLMIIMEHKITIAITDIPKTIEQISQILNKEHNPEEYRSARFYFWGSVILLVFGMVLLRA